MKLVEILARELKEWPEGWPAVGQASDGSLHGEPFTGRHTEYKIKRAKDYMIAIVTRAQWQEARDSLNKPAVEAWNGEGLPPVGMHVVVHDDGSLVYGHGESGEVLAHVDGCAVIRMSYGLGCFLPRVLRTPEQTQQEERENTIAEMACIVRSVFIIVFILYMCYRWVMVGAGLHG